MGRGAAAVYCYICSKLAVTACAQCDSHVCARHRRRWFLGVPLCTRCSRTLASRVVASAAVLLAIAGFVCWLAR